MISLKPGKKTGNNCDYLKGSVKAKRELSSTEQTQNYNYIAVDKTSDLDSDRLNGNSAKSKYKNGLTCSLTGTSLAAKGLQTVYSSANKDKNQKMTVFVRDQDLKKYSKSLPPTKYNIVNGEFDNKFGACYAIT